MLTLQQMKEFCLKAADNEFQITPMAGIYDQYGNDKGARHIVKKAVAEGKGYFPHEKVISRNAVEGKWGEYEATINSSSYGVPQVMNLFCGQHITGGYAILGIDLDFTDKAKIAEVEAIITRRKGKLVGKVGSKGVCYIVKYKIGEFAPYKCAGSTKKDMGEGEEKPPFPIDWLTGSKGEGHYMNFIPPGINLKTKQPYRWVTDATVFNTHAKELITVGSREYHDICRVTDYKAVNKDFGVKGETLADRINTISAYRCSLQNNEGGEFEPNLLSNMKFFGQIIKGRNAKLYLPTAMEFEEWYYDIWDGVYAKHNKGRAPRKEEGYLAEKILGTTAKGDNSEEEMNSEGWKKPATDTKEALYWLEEHPIDTLCFSNGNLYEYTEGKEENNGWNPVDTEKMVIEIQWREGCGRTSAILASLTIMSIVRQNKHSHNVKLMVRNRRIEELSKIRFKNTTVSIIKGEIVCGPCKKEDYVLNSIDYDYKPDAECPAIMKHMEYLFRPDSIETEGVTETEEELNKRRDQNISVVSQWLAHSLVPYNGFAKSLFIHGASRTGKSTIGKVHQKFLNGESFGRVEVVLGNLALNEFSDPNSLARIAGKLIAICGDSEGNPSKADLAVWKRWIGGDALTLKILYKDVHDIVPYAKYLNIGNTEVQFKNTDPVAIYERLISIKSTSRTYPEKERMQDSALMDSLTTKEEMEGYGAMMVKSLAQLHKNERFILADWQLADAKSVTAESTPVSEFAEIRLKGQWKVYDPKIHDRNNRITCDHFREDFLRWMNIHHPEKVKYWESKSKIGTAANDWLKGQELPGYQRANVSVTNAAGKKVWKNVFFYPLVKGTEEEIKAAEKAQVKAAEAQVTEDHGNVPY